MMPHSAPPIDLTGSADTETGIRSTFVGRGAQLALLRAAVEGAAGGCGRVVLVSGEAGIGKTRLVDEVAAIATQMDVDVLWGRCWDGEETMSFWPWIQIVRSYFARTDPAVVKSIPTAAMAHIAQLIPDFPDRTTTSSPPDQAIDAEQARFRQFDSFCTLLRAATLRTPLLLVIDDIHKADACSLLLLRFIAREISDLRLVVIATHRDDPIPTPNFSAFINDIVPAASTIRLPLRGLSLEEVTAFISTLANAATSPAFAELIQTETDGNPLFVSEIVRLMILNGHSIAEWRPSVQKLALPDTIRNVIRQRLERISECARELLEIASVIGGDFYLATVARIMNTDSRQLLVAIDEGAKHRLVIKLADGAAHFRFMHSLIRDVIYSDVSEMRRAELHYAAAEALEIDPPLPGQIAALSYHLFQALPISNAEKVVRYARQAAVRANAMLAYEDASTHFGRAIAAYPMQSGDLREYCDLLIDRGEIQNRAGDIQGAKVSFRSAAELARTTGSAEQLARAALGFGGSFAATGAPDRELIGLLQEALSELGDDETPQHAMLLAGLSIALHFHGAVDERLSLSQRAVTVARNCGDKVSELFALDARHYALHYPGRLRERIASDEQMVVLGREARHKEMILRGCQRLFVDLWQLGDVPGADRWIAEYVGLADELRQPRYQWQACLVLASRSIVDGQFENAIMLQNKGLELGRNAHDDRAIPSFWAQRFAFERYRACLDEFQRHAEQFVTLYPDVAVWQVVRIYLLAEMGHIAEARSLLQALTSRLKIVFRQDAFTLGTLSVLAETCATLQEAGPVQSLYDALQPFGGEFITLGLGAVFLGSTAHYMGVLGGIVGRYEQAAADFERALAANTKVGARPLAARSCYEYGRVLAQIGRRDEARRQLMNANEEFDRLGMTVCLERGRVALAALGVSSGKSKGGARSAQPVGVESGEAVFRNEGDYWTISFGGKTLRLRGVRGFTYIAYLLERANVPVHAMDLAGIGVRSTGATAPAAVAQQEALRVTEFGGQETTIDARAWAEYRGRLRQLSAERDEAEQIHDYGALERIDREVTFINDLLKAGSATGGRGRRWTSPSERARVNVRNSIATALRVFEENHHPLHRHLQNSIHTGAVCTYAPEAPVGWVVALH